MCLYIVISQYLSATFTPVNGLGTSSDVISSCFYSLSICVCAPQSCSLCFLHFFLPSSPFFIRCARLPLLPSSLLRSPISHRPSPHWALSITFILRPESLYLSLLLSLPPSPLAQSLSRSQRSSNGMMGGWAVIRSYAMQHRPLSPPTISCSYPSP